MQPLYDSLSDMLSSIKLNEYMENGTIQISPLGFMKNLENILKRKYYYKSNENVFN